MKPTPQTYDELQQAYDHFNIRLFENQLPQCIITLQRQKRTAGYYSYARFIDINGQKTDEIALNPHYIDITDITEAMQTLVHEMVHQWQTHHGEPSRRTYHNRQWADKMESIGLMPSDTGRPGGKRTGQSMSDYPINGGAFLVALDELTSADFRLTWRDRFGYQSVASPIGELGEGAVTITLVDTTTGEIQEQKSSKVKYTHHCLHKGNAGFIYNAWGKPDLPLACAYCGDPFIPLVS